MAFVLCRIQLRGEVQPGKQNDLADAQSRRPDYGLAHVTTLSSSILELIRAADAQDVQCVALLRELGKNDYKDWKVNCRHVRVQGFSDTASMMACSTISRI